MTNDELPSGSRFLVVTVCPADGEFAVRAQKRDLVFTSDRQLAEAVALDLSLVPLTALNAGLDLDAFASNVLRSHLTQATLQKFREQAQS